MSFYWLFVVVTTLIARQVDTATVPIQNLLLQEANVSYFKFHGHSF